MKVHLQDIMLRMLVVVSKMDMVMMIVIVLCEIRTLQHDEERGVWGLLLPTTRDPALSPGWRDRVRHPTSNPQRKEIAESAAAVGRDNRGPMGLGGPPATHVWCS